MSQATVKLIYSFVECDGILEVQYMYQKVSITAGMEGFDLMKLSDLLKKLKQSKWSKLTESMTRVRIN